MNIKKIISNINCTDIVVKRYKKYEFLKKRCTWKKPIMIDLLIILRSFFGLSDYPHYLSTFQVSMPVRPSIHIFRCYYYLMVADYDGSSVDLKKIYHPLVILLFFFLYFCPYNLL